MFAHHGKNRSKSKKLQTCYAGVAVNGTQFDANRGSFVSGAA